ncbi:hypothetical protein GJU40_10640 [Bacillus lacus]|uniref:LPXTG cell wall anchor domain-containing protein n=1 Tax=Metabacillus lacus TaxID=1983721 RepID=A0A7X2M0B0_9BACI|nr:TasA family protein [Metabacillus lacus]MRX72604.1 hypothetical protein [Metabacillus lacus]
MNAKIKSTIAVLISVIFFLNLLGVKGSTMYLSEGELDISLYPQEIVMNAENLKPGDSIIYPIQVKNTGFTDFYYVAEIQFLGGSQDFYEQLNLLIKRGKNTIFKNKASHWHPIKPVPLTRLSSDSLTINTEIPFELGNEYQGASCSFRIIFTANKDVISLTPPADSLVPGGQLPDEPIVEQAPVVQPGKKIEVSERIVTEHNDLNEALPHTSTNSFNIIFAGFIFFIMGMILRYFKNSKGQ